MSTLKELLGSLPVEWITIEDLFNIKNGYTPSKKINEYWTNGTIPWFRMEDIRSNGRILNNSIQHVSSSAVKGNNLFPANSIIISTSATIGEVALITVPYLSNQRFTNLSLKPEFIEKFDIYFLLYYSFYLGEWCKENVTVGNFAGVDMAGFKKFKFPIPHPNDPKKSLEIQQKIVRVLDSLSEQNKALTTALANEIENRKKQYAYYREELFRFEGKEVEWKTLGEVASIGTGSHDTKDAVEDGIYTFYARGVNPLKLNSYDFDETAIITAGDGVGVGKVFHWVEGKYALHQRAYKIVPIYDINARYIYYYIVTNFLGYVEKQSVHSSVTSLRKPMFIKFPIAIPSTQEQERIVRLLDQYDEAAKSIVAAIKKEIELRNKQFEYYRNLLLTFPKLKEVY